MKIREERFIQKAKLCLVFMLFTIAVFCLSMRSQAAMSVDDIKIQVTEIYQKALNMSGRSTFNGLCGLCVNYELRAMGIFGAGSFNGNGNQWFDGLVDGDETAGGYTQTKYAGSTCLTDIVNAYNGNPVYNIVVSFPYGAKASTRPYGHVNFIHAIIDGKVYYTESYSTSGCPEGSLIVKSVDDFVSTYTSLNGAPLGAIHFTNGSEDIQIVTDISTEDLFKRYPRYLYNDYVDDAYQKIFDLNTEIMKRQSATGDWWASFLKSLKEGKEIILRELLANLGFDSQYELQMDEATVGLMLEACSIPKVAEEIVDKTQTEFKDWKTTYDFASDTGKSLFIDDMLKKFPKMTRNQVTEFIDGFSDIMTGAADGLEAWQYIVGAAQMYQIELGLVEELERSMQGTPYSESDLHEGLVRMERDLRGYAAEQFVEKYGSKKFITMISNAVDDLLLGKTPYMLAAKFMINLLVNEYEGPTADDIIQVTFLGNYANTSSNMMVNHRIELIKKTLTNEKIAEAMENYANWFNMRRAGAIVLADALEPFATATEKRKLEGYAAVLKTSLTYEKYIALCKADVLEAINNGTVIEKDVPPDDEAKQKSWNVIKERFANIQKAYP